MSKLWQETQAQDLVEYTLLLAFIVLAVGCLLLAAGSSVASVQATGSQVLDQAQTSLNQPPGTPPSPPAAPPPSQPTDPDPDSR